MVHHRPSLLGPDTLLKVLGPDGEAYNGGHGKWYLPHGDRPGHWMPQIKGRLVPCDHGYHVCTLNQLLPWLGPKIATVEVRGERLDCDDKIVVRQARLLRVLDTWNERTARLFSCDCGEWALSLVPEPHPDSVNAIVVSRRFANGQATADELASAVRLAWSAARSADDSAVGSAWSAWAAARSAAWSAARSAAWSAAWSAAGSAAARTAAAKAYMTDQLLCYLRGELA